VPARAHRAPPRDNLSLEIYSIYRINGAVPCDNQMRGILDPSLYRLQLE
jgi:hypothetical protein